MSGIYNGVSARNISVAGLHLHVLIRLYSRSLNLELTDAASSTTVQQPYLSVSKDHRRLCKLFTRNWAIWACGIELEERPKWQTTRFYWKNLMAFEASRIIRKYLVYIRGQIDLSPNMDPICLVCWFSFLTLLQNAYFPSWQVKRSPGRGFRHTLHDLPLSFSAEYTKSLRHCIYISRSKD